MLNEGIDTEVLQLGGRVELLQENAAPDKKVVRLNRALLRLYPYEALQAVVIVNVENLHPISSTCRARVVKSRTGRLSMCLEVMNTFFIGSSIPM